MKFRRGKTQQGPEGIYTEARLHLCPSTILIVKAVRCFTKRTLKCCQESLALGKGGEIQSKGMVEKIRGARCTKKSLYMKPDFTEGRV